MKFGVLTISYVENLQRCFGKLQLLAPLTVLIHDAGIPNSNASAHRSARSILTVAQRCIRSSQCFDFRLKKSVVRVRVMNRIAQCSEQYTYYSTADSRILSRQWAEVFLA